MKTYQLYNGEVTMTFDKDAPRYRYKVTDPNNGISDKPVRGVTTLLRDVIHKPDLLMWPMNEALTHLFGQEFNKTEKAYKYREAKAAVKSNMVYTTDELETLLNEARSAHTKKSDRGKDVGTLVHTAIEYYLRGQDKENALQSSLSDAGGVTTQDVMNDTMRALTAFVAWWEGLEEKEVLGLENPVYSRTLQYSGTYDLIARINGKVYMLDFKTTNKSMSAPLGIYAEYFLQLAAYAYAVKEERGYEFDDLGIINVGKDGVISIATATDLGMTIKECETTFAYAVRLHDWLDKTARLTKDRRLVSVLNPLEKVEVQQ